MVTRCFSLVILLCFPSLFCFGQTDSVCKYDFLDDVAKEVDRKIKLFVISSNDCSNPERPRHVKQSQMRGIKKACFIGEGNPYPIVIPTDSGHTIDTHAAVVVHVDSPLKLFGPKQMSLDEYASRLIDGANFSKRYHNRGDGSRDSIMRRWPVILHFADVVRIDDPVKIDDSTYMAVAHVFYKMVESHRMGLDRYYTFLMKCEMDDVCVYIKKTETPQGFPLRKSAFDRVKLGDVYCNCFWKPWFLNFY